MFSGGDETSTAYGGRMLDLRQSVRDAVVARRPVDARERDSIAAFVERFDALDRPFDEHADRVHVTASAIVVTADRSRVLLHQHKRLGLWLQPGGHIDAGETTCDAAVREAREETGLPVEPVSDGQLIHVDVHPGPRRHTHLDVRYLVESPDVAPAPPPGESQEVRWFHWYQAIDLAEPGLEGILRALQPGEPKIRAARPRDAGDAATVYLRSRAFAIPSILSPHSPGDVRRWMADDVVGRSDVWVAELDGVVVGLLVLQHDRDGSWLDHLYLDPSWMGRGLGDRMMAVAKERSPGGLQLWTFQVNGAARRFYERHGFVEQERTAGSGNEERAPDARYRWLPAA
jgi:8-oxo-dGTP pyrophosphatase MutT (NUDIX family)/GNAT superfamily N-acetyltransferase